VQISELINTFSKLLKTIEKYNIRKNMSLQEKPVQINNNIDTSSSGISAKEKNAVMKKLEAEGEKKLAELQSTNTLTIDSLTAIMENGFKEFKKKTGENLTYAEMRAMYG